MNTTHIDGSMPSPDLSIVICTHRRFALLEGAVASLAEEEAVDAPFQVLVVDNDLRPNPELQAIVQRYRNTLEIHYRHPSAS